MAAHRTARRRRLTVRRWQLPFLVCLLWLWARIADPQGPIPLARRTDPSRHRPCLTPGSPSLHARGDTKARTRGTAGIPGHTEARTRGPAGIRGAPTRGDSRGQARRGRTGASARTGASGADPGTGANRGLGRDRALGADPGPRREPGPRARPGTSCGPGTGRGLAPTLPGPRGRPRAVRAGARLTARPRRTAPGPLARATSGR